MGYILTPGVNGVNGVKEEGRGMEGIWGKSPARGKRAATGQSCEKQTWGQASTKIHFSHLQVSHLHISFTIAGF